MIVSFPEVVVNDTVLSRCKTGSFRRATTGRKIVLNSTHHVTEYTMEQVDEMLRWCGFTLTVAGGACMPR